MTLNIAHDLANHPVQRLPIHDATELTDGGSLANIQLGEQVYTLRITRAGKLILTK
ncbi:hemin uptake protein HemP [uncultured Pelagimonas sp.]|uniref:hemin uptake protein HemP n=1 Tax=uncultured Pelagimonas sp. TaxID=1618102 RepID=UPI00262DD0F6|nr:hemin uptake protein HemP [uncultured Pelagimonas sp.]